MAMATGGITASLFWAQSEWAGPRRHTVSLKSASLSITGLALVTATVTACYPTMLEGCIRCFPVPVFADYCHDLHTGGAVLRASCHPAAQCPPAL